MIKVVIIIKIKITVVIIYIYIYIYVFSDHDTLDHWLVWRFKILPHIFVINLVIHLCEALMLIHEDLKCSLHILDT